MYGSVTNVLKCDEFYTVSVVNDPNLKRIDGHIRYQRTHYGLKAELLMVQDGGHVSIFVQRLTLNPSHV